MNTTITEQARFVARLPKEQKQFFEKAAYLGGYKILLILLFGYSRKKQKKL